MKISLAGSPTCLAELRRAIRSSLAAVPGAIPDDVVDDVVLAVSEAATNAVLYGSGDAQPVTVTVRVGGGWIEATIRDWGRPGHVAGLAAAPAAHVDVAVGSRRARG